MASRVEVMLALNAHATKRCAELAVNATAELIEATPIDTGWARANWIPSLGEASKVTVGAPDAPSTAEQTAGLAAVLAFKLEDGRLFVSNHVPYIGRLDAGSSTQAPAGFVRTAIAKAIIATGSGQLR